MALENQKQEPIAEEEQWKLVLAQATNEKGNIVQWLSLLRKPRDEGFPPRRYTIPVRSVNFLLDSLPKAVEKLQKTGGEKI